MNTFIEYAENAIAVLRDNVKYAVACMDPEAYSHFMNTLEEIREISAKKEPMPSAFAAPPNQIEAYHQAFSKKIERDKNQAFEDGHRLARSQAALLTKNLTGIPPEHREKFLILSDEIHRLRSDPGPPTPDELIAAPSNLTPPV